MCPQYKKDAPAGGEMQTATTDRRTFESLSESEIQLEVLAKVFAINPAAICVVRFDNGLIVDVNESWQAMFGYSREEAIGHSALDLNLWLAKVDRDEWIKLMQDYSSIRNVELAVLRKSGERFVALCSAEIMSVADAKFILSTWLDISDRKRMEEELRDSKEYLESIINCLGDAIVVKDQLHRFVLVNDSFLKMEGKTRNEVLGETAYSMLPKDTADLVWKREEDTLNNGTQNADEIGLPDNKGNIRTFMARTARLIDKQGNRQFVGAFRDITDYRRLQQQFLQSQKMEAVGMLAGGVAHDFNNLLNVINGYCEIILEDLGPQDPLRNDVEQISMAGKRASSLTTQLLAFSRKQILQPEMLDLNDLISGMTPMLRRLIRENIEFAALAAPGLGLVSADPSKIQQIIMNLVVNAGDAMPDGGKLIIETANVELDEDYVRRHQAGKPGDYVMLAISDNGVGMDEATQARVFEPFFTTKGKGKGTGLGLSTVYGIVKQSDGYVWVYSEPGKGTTFKIYLPRMSGQAKDPAPENKKERSLRGSETLLVVEDEPAVRALTSRILREQGYTIIEAANGIEALDIARKHEGEINLLITDVIMPGVSGQDLAEQIRASRPDIKTLFVSGYTDNAIAHQGILDADVAFLQKPFTVQSLCRKVRAVLDS